MADFGAGKLANELIQEPFHSSLGSTSGSRSVRNPIT
jgi:hypothetical protein